MYVSSKSAILPFHFHYHRLHEPSLQNSTIEMNSTKLSLLSLRDNEGPFTLSDYHCENEVANNWVLLDSLELFTSSDVKNQIKNFEFALAITQCEQALKRSCD